MNPKRPPEPVWNLFWAPEGKKIATVTATTEREARRRAPMPYRKFLGEIYAVLVTQPKKEKP